MRPSTGSIRRPLSARARSVRALLALLVPLALTPIAALSCSGNTAKQHDDTIAPKPMAFITDAQGRALILHGMNVMNAAKGAPDRLPPITAEDASRIARWGMNFVRYLVFWDAIEPTPGSYDDAYLAKVRAQLDLLQAKGISVMLDVHQDVYAQKFCCDGAPAWAIHDDGKPFSLQSTWSMNYFQPAVTAAFDNFWSHAAAHAELQDRYVAMLGHVAKQLGDHPAIVGWDVMNEPYPGTVFDVSETLFLIDQDDTGTLAKFDRGLFADFYGRAIAAIRAVDRDHWIFVEPRYGAPANGSRSFLPTLVDPRPGERRIAAAPHLYSLRAEANTTYAPEDDTVARWQTRRHDEIAATGDALIVGEFGFDYGMPRGEQYMQDVLDMADHEAIGWAYWSYDPGAGGWSPWNDKTGKDNAPLAWLVRPYARKVAGTPVSMKWDKAARIFELVFTDRDGASGDHEIWMPIALYPTGFLVQYSDPPGTTAQTWSDAASALTVTTPKTGDRHVVTIMPK
jgi:endoglycosylceramidase